VPEKKAIACSSTVTKIIPVVRVYRRDINKGSEYATKAYYLEQPRGDDWGTRSETFVESSGHKQDATDN
jgi:hypothetical protein